MCRKQIPYILTTFNGTLLAFAEARKPTCSDYTWTDLVMKRSLDGGHSWSPLQLVYEQGLAVQPLHKSKQTWIILTPLCLCPQLLELDCREPCCHWQCCACSRSSQWADLASLLPQQRAVHADAQ